MEFFSRQEVEKIGKAGTCTFTANVDTHNQDVPAQVSRQLSSYWIASKPTDRGISEHFKNDGFWEAWISLWISRNVKPGSVCIDAGANYGYFTFQLAQHGCKVLAIEANSELIPYLKKSVELNGCADRVRVMNNAISEVSHRMLTLNLTESSLNSTIINSGQTIAEISVETIALNDVASFEGGIDFVKMDIEGAEELAFAGMQRLWDVNPKCVFLMEFVNDHYAEHGKLFYDRMATDFKIGYVDYNGDEQPVSDFSFFQNDTEDFRMIVLRKK